MGLPSYTASYVPLDWWSYAPDVGQPQRSALFTPGTPVRIPTVIWSYYDPIPHYSPAEWFPVLVPSTEYADFSYDATDDIAPGDSITGLSMVVAPSGPGEVVMSRLSLTNTVAGSPTLVVVWLSGGIAGRTYLYELTITTAALRTLPIIIGQVCLPVLAQYPLAPPPSPNFGTPVTWVP